MDFRLWQTGDHTSPVTLGESIVITDKRPFIPVTDAEVDLVIVSSVPWKSPDRNGISSSGVLETSGLDSSYIQGLGRPRR